MLEEADYVVEALVIQEILIHDRSRRDDADHLPAGKGLGILRKLHLFADGYLLAAVQKPLDVVLGRMVRDAAHRGIPPVRKSQIQQGRYLLGILVEHLVEVAETEEEHHIRVLALDLAVLLHQRGISHNSFRSMKLRWQEQGSFRCSHVCRGRTNLRATRMSSRLPCLRHTGTCRWRS